MPMLLCFKSALLLKFLYGHPGGRRESLLWHASSNFVEKMTLSRMDYEFCHGDVKILDDAFDVRLRIVTLFLMVYNIRGNLAAQFGDNETIHIHIHTRSIVLKKVLIISGHTNM